MSNHEKKKDWEIRTPPSGPIRWPPSGPTPSTVEGEIQPNTPSHLTLREIEGWLKRNRDDIDIIYSRMAWGTHTHTITLPFNYAWFIPDAIAVGNSQGGILRLDRDATILAPTLNIKTAPTGAALIVDMDYSSDYSVWTALWSTRPQINASANTGGGSAVASIATLPSGTWIRLNVDQVGSTVAGSDLTVQFLAEFTATTNIP